ncbi:MAG: GH3 auxin-responsive promoter family protein [Flavobacteriales bacterium]|nr:GH3 auxin-responsive promoter family protein [Flavobacteriales bacterium]MCB9449563.1 GH3 auxin-responsive promoter family protein [Flavobacteriales bacterium]
MSLKASLSIPFARWIHRQQVTAASHAVEVQQKWLQRLLQNARATHFGKEHDFSHIRDHKTFTQKVPLRDYEALKPWIEKVVAGEPDVLWPGQPIYLSKTSGTTSGTKFIPITKDSIPNHIHTARNALLSYIATTRKAQFVDGKMIFLSGSPELMKKNGILTGRLSGIVNHHVPGYLRSNQLPSYTTNCIDDWETKVDAIVEETMNEDMRLISGIPSWVQMYFEKLLLRTGKETIREVFPNFSLFVYGGVNYAPYRPVFEKAIGGKIDSVELYPASEGFIAFQDVQGEEGLLLNVDNGIYFEFVPLDEYDRPNPTRLSLADVELGVNYALLLSTNAGLWAYSIGDTVKFVSKNPYRLIVTGRIKHFISAFGEHVIGEEVDGAMQIAAREFGAEIIEFSVAPQIKPTTGLPYHEWFIEFAKKPADMDGFRHRVDELMQEKNIYYRDLLEGNILQTLVIREVVKDGFIAYMKSVGKLGGQNKVPRLSNDRQLADGLTPFISPGNVSPV